LKLQEKHRKEAKKDLKRQQYWPARHPIISILAVTAVLLTLGIPLASMRLGLPDGASEPVTSSQYKSFMQTTKAFGAGANGMIVAVAELPQRTTGDALNLIEANIGDKISALASVKAVVPSAVSSDHTKVLFQVQPTGGPNDISTTKLVNSLRTLSGKLHSQYGVTLGITGITASNIDVSKKLADALPLYLVTILILSMILLILVFRSILVPVVASAGFLLTVVATLGSVVGVYQLGYLSGLFDVHNPEPILSFLPIIVVGIVFGLAMDYQLFLVSGMREAYVHGASAKQAVIRGVHSGRAVVTAAAIIMITVFGGFAFSEMAIIRPMGLGLAMGVLADAFLIRLVLVPAAMTLLGESAWWLPKWLGKILPDVDVEGAKLERTHHL
jgi:putative drug exporter of the RND superfamily